NEILFAATNTPSKTDTKTNVAPVAARKAPIGQPLIISGKKPPVAEAPRTNDSALSITNQPAGTNAAAAVKIEPPGPAPMSPNEPGPAPANPLVQVAAPVSEVAKVPPSTVFSAGAPAGSQALTSASEPANPSPQPNASPPSLPAPANSVVETAK